MSDAPEPSTSTPAPPNPGAPAPCPLAAATRNGVRRTLRRARRELLDARADAGFWSGYLSSSALSTTTAVCALELLRSADGDEPDLANLVERGTRWLVDHANDDGGFGDTPESPTNISTTTLAWATLAMLRDRRPAGSERESLDDTVAAAERWLLREVGELSPHAIATSIRARYGVDKTFAVPILTLCALAGRFGEGPDAFRDVPQLPFELAALPHAAFRFVGLPVVSYALPALIAIGQVRHRIRPTRNPITRVIRAASRRPTLRKLAAIQPASGGFLEATPLTSFVLMSLIASGERENVVAKRAVEFLRASIRDDGSWPIDTDLATWVTTLSIQAFANGDLESSLDASERDRIARWLLEQQTRTIHPYTHAAPGAWSWTNRSGGVPDADDTPGALVALARLRDAGSAPHEAIDRAASAGVGWLLDLQNRDGGIPTFCRGWGKLPFDRSSPDLTAHALRAFCAWQPNLANDRLATRTRRATERALDFLVSSQAPDGSWTPLWFGNPHTTAEENPVYGTARVLACAPVLPRGLRDRADESFSRARTWLVSVQNEDGGFGGGPGAPSTIEETALAIDALAAIREPTDASDPILENACRWLTARVDADGFPASPIGLYFAKLWYWERLYPVIFTVAALERVLAKPDASRHLPRDGDTVSR